MNNDNSSVFSHISISQWRQFESINIELHPTLTVLTGANGSGKSTILSILEGNLVDGEQGKYLATPEEDKISKKTIFSFSNLFSRLRNAVENTGSSREEIGRIELTDDAPPISLFLPLAASIQ